MKGTEYINHIPNNSTVDYLEQYKDCINLLNNDLHKAKLSFLNIIKINIFLDSKSNNDHLTLRDEIINYSKTLFNSALPAIGIVGQKPAENISLGIEVLYIKDIGKYSIEYKEFKNIPYVVLNNDTVKEIIAAGINSFKFQESILKQSEDAFSIMTDILKQEGLSLANVTRQWNYIENILKQQKTENGSIQNYQVFNEIRSKYYNKYNFTQGYPSATGIGASFGGINIDFYALSDNNSKVISINNPKQKNAYQYSQNVLIGSHISKNEEKSPPMFERAKGIISKGQNKIYISGTASIIGEETIGINDVELQTKTTIENILQLINPDTLSRNGVNTKINRNNFSNIRVYFPNPKDFRIIKHICKSYFGISPIQFLIADICRDELLVEIEAEILI